MKERLLGCKQIIASSRFSIGIVFVCLIGLFGARSWQTAALAQNETLPDAPSKQYLPLVAQQEPPRWRLLANAGAELSALHFEADQPGEANLYLGDRRPPADGGGLYLGRVGESCASDQVFPSVYTGARILSLAFDGDLGVAGTFQEQIAVRAVAQSATAEEQWRRTNGSLNPNVYGVALLSGTIYAGTDGGLYRSEDGDGWVQHDPLPQINALATQAETLWVGTFRRGVYRLEPTSEELLAHNEGLADEALAVWDFASDGEETVYIATSDGVYFSENENSWAAWGLQGELVYSVAWGADTLYAGLREGGVQARQRNGAAWRAPVLGNGWDSRYTVRDLVYDPAYCGGGLFAATNVGLWILER